MWVLLGTLSLVIVGTAGRAYSFDGVIVVNPDHTPIPVEIESAEEIVLPEVVNPNEDISDELESSGEINIPEDIDLPEEPDLPTDTNVPEEHEVTTAVPSNLPTVVLTQGTVVGSYSEDGDYLQFYGIPYADATSGSNRFKAPSNPPAFHDTFIANRRDIKCVRPLGAGYEGTEDCLVANIFTSTLASNRMLPVMVWIKGKEFDRAYEYEPSFENFIDQGVVIVTLNYRESVLGFLCLGTEIAPGNAGLKDIIAGLRWVQGNIAQFGGNPNDITLVGHGSGAAAVDLVTLSPMATGLVHKAIAQSGNALSPWAVTRDSVHYALQVAEAMGHNVTSVDELSQIFERSSVAALMGVINDLDLTDNSLAFAPCIERENMTNVDSFMVKSPYRTLQDGDYLQIPFITGYVDNEGTIRSEEAVEDNWLEKMNESFDDFIQPDLKFENDQEKTEIVQNIRSFYFNDNPINMENIKHFINYHGDTMILVSALREARLRSANTANPLYVYQFSYKGTLGEPFVGPLEVDSAAHSEELAYLFYNKRDNQVPARDRSIGNVLVERWSWFAKTGQPLSITSPVFWPAYTAARSSYLRVLDGEEINQQSVFDVALVNPKPEILAFWNPIYDHYFLDAEGKWEWTDRNDDDDVDDDNGQGGNEVGGGEDGGGDGDGDDDDINSASSPVSYTLTIIAAFTILNKIHLSQILS